MRKSPHNLSKQPHNLSKQPHNLLLHKPPSKQHKLLLNRKRPLLRKTTHSKSNSGRL
jgi:hypothetical protein